MRRKDKEITDIKEIEEIIKKADCCRIALVDNDEPYIVPVNFGYERNTLYFHGALEGRKAEIIRKNNNICFELNSRYSHYFNENSKIIKLLIESDVKFTIGSDAHQLLRIGDVEGIYLFIQDLNGKENLIRIHKDTIL